MTRIINFEPFATKQNREKQTRKQRRELRKAQKAQEMEDDFLNVTPELNNLKRIEHQIQKLNYWMCGLAVIMLIINELNLLSIISDPKFSASQILYVFWFVISLFTFSIAVIFIYDYMKVIGKVM